jgi:class 3 adenylate cyclase
MVGDVEFERWFARLERLGASPGAAVALLRMNSRADARACLPAVQVPTLVMHKPEDLMVNIEHGRYLARNIPDSQLLELPGRDHFPWLDNADLVLDHAERFLTGHLSKADPDKVFGTVLFTDIVDSTGRLSLVGDESWRRTLDEHYAIIRRALREHDGTEVQTTGDGFLAVFEGTGRAVRAALAIRDRAKDSGTQVRAGLHAGEFRLAGRDVTGLAVHVAARVMSRAGADTVLTTQDVRDLDTDPEVSFDGVGAAPLKGVPGEWPLFRVERQSA